MPKLTIVSVCLFSLNEQFACQLCLLPFIYSEITPRGNVYLLIKCVGKDFKTLINTGTQLIKCHRAMHPISWVDWSFKLFGWKDKSLFLLR